MNTDILFDKDHQTISDDGRSAFSEILYIPVGKVALLSLYNMFSELKMVTDEVTGKKSLDDFSCVVVHKMSLSHTGNVIVKPRCGGVLDIRSEEYKLLWDRQVRHEPVYQCGCQWTINPCNNMAILPIPGFFQLEFVDPNQFNTAYVEFSFLTVAESLAMPDDFKLGSLK